MERWENKIAVVTGASSGIGAAITTALVNAGLVVIGLARRTELIEQLKQELPAKNRNRLHVHLCDVSDAASINKAFDYIIEKFGGVDVLVNNAGIAHFSSLAEADFSSLNKVMQTNFNGAVFCTIRAFNSMRQRKFDGHIFMINSVVGHSLPSNLTPGRVPNMNVYPASKFALRAVTEIFRQEFAAYNTKVKISSISPGFVDTPIVPTEAAALLGDKKLQPENIAQSLLHVLATEPNVQVHEMIIKPVGEIF